MVLAGTPVRRPSSARLEGVKRANLPIHCVRKPRRHSGLYVSIYASQIDTVVRAQTIVRPMKCVSTGGAAFVDKASIAKKILSVSLVHVRGIFTVAFWVGVRSLLL